MEATGGEAEQSKSAQLIGSGVGGGPWVVVPVVVDCVVAVVVGPAVVVVVVEASAAPVVVVLEGSCVVVVAWVLVVVEYPLIATHLFPCGLYPSSHTQYPHVLLAPFNKLQ